MWGDLLEETGLSGLLTAGRWVTLSNGKRIKLDVDGRIVAGMPSRFHGTHVGDLGKLAAAERQLLGVDCAELSRCHTCRETFRTKDEAYAALLEANPRLDQLRQSEFGSYDLEFLRWQRRGRRGPKPRTTITDGRMDSINEHYDLRGVHRVASFTEAIFHAIPSSRRWGDLEARLPPLAEAAGFEVHLPDQAIRISLALKSEEECQAEVDRRLGVLFEEAKAGRVEPSSLPAPTTDEPVPF